MNIYTVCPRSSDQFYIVSYYIKWVSTSWTFIPTVLPWLLRYMVGFQTNFAHFLTIFRLSICRQMPRRNQITCFNSRAEITYHLTVNLNNHGVYGTKLSLVVTYFFFSYFRLNITFLNLFYYDLISIWNLAILIYDDYIFWIFF